jgi:hypothetical protein
MATINGLPAHALLVHFVVVLAPLTAVLAIVSAVWQAARQRLVWLVLSLALLTPLTTEASEWLEHRSERSPLLHVHTELGDTMIYFSVALVAAALLLTYVHIRESRGRSVNSVVLWSIAAVVISAGVATTVQVYRIGDSGAAAVWGQNVADATP